MMLMKSYLLILLLSPWFSSVVTCITVRLVPAAEQMGFFIFWVVQLVVLYGSDSLMQPAFRQDLLTHHSHDVQKVLKVCKGCHNVSMMVLTLFGLGVWFLSH